MQAVPFLGRTMRSSTKLRALAKYFYVDCVSRISTHLFDVLSRFNTTLNTGSDAVLIAHVSTTK